MALIEIDFEWQKNPAGYRIVDGSPGDSSPDATILGKLGRAASIEPISKELVPYKMSNRHSEHYIEFANVRTHDDVLKFCNEYGLLTDKRPSIPEILQYAQWFRIWLRAKRGNRQQIESLISAGFGKMTRLDASLEADNSGKVRLRLKPQHLLSFMAIQLALATANEKARECKHCGTWFTAGPGTGRRLDSKFCSKEHQRDHNNQNRGQKTRKYIVAHVGRG